ncbi:MULTISPECIES: group 1 truncated hemoglobin [unclassified Pseudomonas]|uniref:group I truncated hemoglobin n=1 Tax=unclassified Pseudomonas TaxID=196821 RepID=UPI000965DE44|nr:MULTISPECIES: group 1 truncated hemoglobin [unclassified Pseudomonas]OLU15424.1 group 1 truncated hemoglobin [Pseudomonas sp. PA1(2017)]OLU32635.1 group 1 truncated hemoglobin [Pseudomonas sp. PA27(2017)]
MRSLCIALLALVLIGCAQQPAKDDSLYRDLGEKPGITRIVEGMLINVAGDPRIVQFFAKVDIAGLRDKLVDKFCVIAGGPCVYTGDSLEESHKGQNLSPSHFNALVENLQASMDSQGVPTPVQNRLLARLAALRGQVIEK